MRELEQHLEPRVARVEAQVNSALEAINALTANVQNLSNAIQKQGDESVKWRENLMLAVERAGAPRRTDWSLLLTLAGFALALGAVAFTPLNWRINEVQRDVDKVEPLFAAHMGKLKGDVDRVESLFTDHLKLTLHPVGASKVEAMERSLIGSSQKNAEAIRELDAKLQREFGLVNQRIDERVNALVKQFDVVQKEGSPITRERLAVMEHALRDLTRHYDRVHPETAQP